MSINRSIPETITRALVLLSLCAGFFSLARPGCAELIGATKLLDQLKQMKPTEPPAAPAGPGKALEKELEAFNKQVDTLAPEEAVRQWLAYYDRFWALPADQRSMQPQNTSEALRMMAQAGIQKSPPISIARVLGALPGPAAWPFLEKAVEVRATKAPAGSLQEFPLRFVTFLLCGRRDLILKDLESIKSKAERLEDYQKRNFLQNLSRVELKLPGSDRGMRSVAERFERLLEIQEKIQDKAAGASVVKVPALVRLVGEPKAAELIRRALKLSRVQLTVPEGGATLKLTQRLALEMHGTLKTPQWGLVASAGDVDFFEAMRKQFSETKRADAEGLAQALESGEFSSMIERSRGNGMEGMEDESNNELYGKARCYALLGLVGRGRMQDATSLTLQMANGSSFGNFYEVWRMSDQPALAPGLFALLGKVLAQKPDLTLWEEYIALGLIVDKVDAMLQTVRAVAERKDLKPEIAIAMKKQLVQALLAADQIDPAVTLIREVLQVKGEHETPKARLAIRQSRAEVAIILAKLGWLLKRPEWLTEGAQATRAIAAEPDSEVDQMGYGSYFIELWSSKDLVPVLIKSERYGEAEKILLSAMQGVLDNSTRLGQNGDEDNVSSALLPSLAQLTMVYSKAKRPKDVMILLEQAPWWGAPDLKAVLRNYQYQVDKLDLARAAAEALVDAGRKAEAVSLLKTELYRDPSNDKNYGLLTDLEGLSLIPWLDELYLRDRFEERPLVWKAWLLFKANRLEEAEATARKAIAIDPTDGEQPEGDRLRGYSVLSEILAARGKRDEANLLQRVVRSVRLAERGDELAEAGLIARSLKVYEEANTVFADAYCVRWRLAEKLYAMGDRAAAEKNYQHAFELMPEQFGRVASLCFGCAQVFNNQRSQTIGERVLGELLKRYPQKPQVHYILGMLRVEQQRFQDAYEAFRQAVKLDPEYLDAWRQLSEVADTLYLPAAERDAIALRMLQLDPLARHFSVREEIEDFAGMWKVMEAARKYAVTPPQSLLALPASKERLEARKKSGAQRSFDDYAQIELEQERLKKARPAEAFTRMPLITSMLELDGALLE